MTRVSLARGQLFPGEQGSPAGGIDLRTTGFRESDLRQDATRGDIPIPDGGPEMLIPACSRPVDDHPGSFCRVTVAPGSPQQLEGQFRFPFRAASAVDQSAIADDIPVELPFDREQTDRRRLVCPDRIFKFRQCRMALCIYTTMGRYSWIPFAPQLTHDPGLGHSPRPQQQPARLKQKLTVLRWRDLTDHDGNSGMWKRSRQCESDRAVSRDMRLCRERRSGEDNSGLSNPEVESVPLVVPEPLSQKIPRSCQLRGGMAVTTGVQRISLSREELQLVG